MGYQPERLRGVFRLKQREPQDYRCDGASERVALLLLFGGHVGDDTAENREGGEDGHDEPQSAVEGRKRGRPEGLEMKGAGKFFKLGGPVKPLTRL